MKKVYSVFAVVIAVVLLSATPLFNVRHVLINGEINDNHSIAQMLKTQNFFWTTADSMSRQIEANRMYETASVKKKFLLNIDIDLVERAPFVAIKSGGYYVVIDEYGVVLALPSTPEAPYVIEGFKVTSAVLGEHLVAEEMQLVERAVQIVYMYQVHTEFFPKVSLREDHIIQDMGDGIFVDYGQAEDVELQFNLATVIYKDLLEKGSTSGVINVTNPEQPFVEPVKQ